jgi:phosphatidylglycerol:prolipoprotein diacylglycerol transferase
MPASFIAGIYLLLNAIARFVEESLRGEAQTPYWAGMRIYQWIAIVNMIAGAIFTCIPSGMLPPFQLNMPAFYWALTISILSSAAYGLDFPNSNRRFARLTSN